MTPQEEYRILKNLTESAGWLWLMEVGEQQRVGRTDEIILKPLPNLDSALAQEFAKGEISGIRLFFEIPKARIGSLEAQLAAEAANKPQEEQESHEYIDPD